MILKAKVFSAAGGEAAKPLNVQFGCFDQPADGGVDTDVAPKP